MRNLAVSVIFEAARSTGENRLEIAKLQSLYAKRILEKARLRKPYEYKLFFCKKCKRFSPIGVTRRVRIRRKRVILFCELCGE